MTEITRDKQKTVEEFFRELLLLLANVDFAPGAKTLVKTGLVFLLEESKKARWQRDHKSVKEVWLILHPALDRTGMLSPYRNDVALKGHLEFFIKNGFGINVSKSANRR